MIQMEAALSCLLCAERSPGDPPTDPEGDRWREGPEPPCDPVDHDAEPADCVAEPDDLDEDDDDEWDPTTCEECGGPLADDEMCPECDPEEPRRD